MQRDMQAKRAANNAASVADLPALEAMVAAALAPLEALLELEFAVDGSGRRVSWGKATVQDHLDRIRYMQDKSDQILADAAKHQQAVDLLAVTGCLTLSDVRSVVGS